MRTTRQFSRIECLAAVLGGMVFAHAEKAIAVPPSSITLVNETGQTLTFYAVNEDPPPSRLPSGTTPDGGTFDIDPEGYNPVLAWADGINLDGTGPNGFQIGLALTEEPPLIQYKLFHYKVTPGTPGKDPDLQPLLIHQELLEPTEDEVFIVVDSDWNATLGAPAGACCDWAAYHCTDGVFGFDCRGADEEWSQDVLCANLEPPCAATGACCTYGGGCSDVPASSCPDGVSATFISGASCTSSPCDSNSETIDAETGGTVETPDGAVSVEFDPGDLCDDATVSITQRESGELHYVYLTGSSEVEMEYHFEPDNLEFCGDVILCMTLDVTDLSMAERLALRLSRRGLACGAPNTCDYCNTDGDCGGATCEVRFCGLQALPCSFSEVDGRTIAECCADIGHFSDYALITHADTDLDGVPDNFEGVVDNCRVVWNPSQTDTDGDGIGDVCDCWFPNLCGAGVTLWPILLLGFGTFYVTRRRKAG